MVIVAVVLLVNGCVMAPHSNQSRSTASQAFAAQTRGDWAEAAELWAQAIQVEQGIWSDPELANSPKRITIYYYELGRSLGVLGQYVAAEENLLVALRLDRKFNGPQGMDLVELARLNHARGNNARAASFFDQVIPRLDEVSEKDPAGYAAILNEAAATYLALGQTNQATELQAKAVSFAANHPDLSFPNNYRWTPYKIKTSASK